jgi:hypothetical protein
MTINGYVARWFLTYLSEGAKVPRKDVETKRSGKIVAEKMGFEPTIPFRVYSLSRGAPSTTRPPLRTVPKKGTMASYLLRHAGVNHVAAHA